MAHSFLFLIYVFISDFFENIICFPVAFPTILNPDQSFSYTGYHVRRKNPVCLFNTEWGRKAADSCYFHSCTKLNEISVDLNRENRVLFLRLLAERFMTIILSIVVFKNIRGILEENLKLPRFFTIYGIVRFFQRKIMRRRSYVSHEFMENFPSFTDV